MPKAYQKRKQICYTIHHTNKVMPGRQRHMRYRYARKQSVDIMENIPTPWGAALTKLELTEGVLWVETAEHGGLLIEKAQARTLLSDPALKIGQPWENYLAYEQASAMMVVFYEHPELYPWVEEELTEKLAADNLRLCHPEYFSH